MVKLRSEENGTLAAKHHSSAKKASSKAPQSQGLDLVIHKLPTNEDESYATNMRNAVGSLSQSPRKVGILSSNLPGATQPLLSPRKAKASKKKQQSTNNDQQSGESQNQQSMSLRGNNQYGNTS